MVRSSRLAHDGSTLLPDVTDPGLSRIPLAVPLTDPAAMCARTAAVSSGPGTRSARGNAERRSARSRHSGAGCNHAPRPGSRRRGSGVSTPCTTTTRNRPSADDLARHPIQVRTGPTVGASAVVGVGHAGAEPELRAASECSAASAPTPLVVRVPALSPPTPSRRRWAQVHRSAPVHRSSAHPAPRPARRPPPAGRRRCGCRCATR